MIKGEKLLFRAPEPEDLPLIYTWENDPEVRAVSHLKVPVSAFAVEQYILNYSRDPFDSGELRLMAVQQSDGQVVGHLDLFEIDPLNRRAGVGILVDSRFRGQGYALEMIAMVSEWVRKALDLHQLWCTVGINNHDSIKLFLKAGFKQTGIRQGWIRSEGEWEDEVFLQRIL
jgi:diamine N-acetyltransferase